MEELATIPHSSCQWVSRWRQTAKTNWKKMQQAMALWPLQLPLLLLDCDSKYISSQSSFLIHPVWQYPITDTLFLGVSYGVCRLRTALIGEPSAVSQDKTEHAADKMSPSRIPEGGGHHWSWRQRGHVCGRASAHAAYILGLQNYCSVGTGQGTQNDIRFFTACCARTLNKSRNRIPPPKLLLLNHVYGMRNDTRTRDF